jgi:uncharacterized protein YndB with AHSA1/START domain
MKIDLSFREFYPHPIEKVWAAVSERDALAAWLMESDFEPIVGKRFRFVGAASPEWRGWMDCEVIAIEAPSRIVWSWQAAEADAPGRVEIRLKSVEGGTELTLTHTGETDPGRRSRYASGSGWPGKLTELGKQLS